MKNKKLFFVLYGVFLLLLFELSLRAFFFFYYPTRTSFFASTKIIFTQFAYPDVASALKDPPTAENFNVGFFSLSVMNDERRLTERIKREFDDVARKKMKIYQFATPAQSTLDSYYKYRLLADMPLDLAVYYHGINDIRSNYVPPNLWKEDYGHYSWYAQRNFFFENETLFQLPSIIPFGMAFISAQLKTRLQPEQYVSVENLTDSALQYGKKFKSAEVFEKNTRHFIELAQQRNQPIVLVTFVHFHPEKSPFHPVIPKKMERTRLWGDPVDVERGLEIHNEVLRSLARQYNVPLIDLAREFPDEQSKFEDICHMTYEGADFFAAAFMKKLIKLFPAIRSNVAHQRGH